MKNAYLGLALLASFSGIAFAGSVGLDGGGPAESSPAPMNPKCADCKKWGSDKDTSKPFYCKECKQVFAYIDPAQQAKVRKALAGAGATQVGFWSKSATTAMVAYATVAPEKADAVLEAVAAFALESKDLPKK